MPPILRTRKNSLRFPGYDYSQPGYYFVTISTKNNDQIFGIVENGKMTLNALGTITRKVWLELPNHYQCALGDSVVMPNHFHGILIIPPSVRAGFKPARTEGGTEEKKRHSLSEIIRGFKTFTAREINIMRNTPGIPVWHRGFYDHIIRNERALNSIRDYILLNPVQWARDKQKLSKTQVSRNS